ADEIERTLPVIQIEAEREFPPSLSQRKPARIHVEVRKPHVTDLNQFCLYQREGRILLCLVMRVKLLASRIRLVQSVRAFGLAVLGLVYGPAKIRQGEANAGTLWRTNS